MFHGWGGGGGIKQSETRRGSGELCSGFNPDHTSISSILTEKLQLKSSARCFFLFKIVQGKPNPKAPPPRTHISALFHSHY